MEPRALGPPQHSVVASPDEVVIVLSGVPPVSLQGTPGNKVALTDALRAVISTTDRIALDDVRVTVEWVVHEDERYLGTSSPDIDNILKPILDAISGPAGVVANDCQVQSAHALWIDGPPWAPGAHRLEVRIGAMPDSFYPKRGIYWVEWPDGYCWPMWSTMPHEAALMLLQGFDRQLAQRTEVIGMGVDPTQAKLFLPATRRFGRGRVRDFEVVSFAVARDALEAHAHAAAGVRMTV
jgi:hypothetical protein